MAPAREYPVLAGSGPLSFAHRGGAGLFPENTLEAFAGAVAFGCTHLETDLRMTRDGEIVLMHDADVARTTDGSGTVESMTLAELKELDAAHHFTPDGTSYPERGRGIRVPTLEQALEAQPGARFNVEIKTLGPNDLPRALWSLIERRSLHDRLLVAAERHELIRRFRRLSGGRVATGASRRECLGFWLASRLGLESLVRPGFQALQVPVSLRGLPVVTPRFLRAAGARGCVVHVWTIDDPVEMRRLLSLGVQGLMSDRPDRLSSVLGDRSGDLDLGSRRGGAAS